METITKEMLLRRHRSRWIAPFGTILMVVLSAIWLIVSSNFGFRAGSVLQVFVPFIGVPVCILIGVVITYRLAQWDNKRPMEVPKNVRIHIRIDTLIDKHLTYHSALHHKDMPSGYILKFKRAGAKDVHKTDYEAAIVGDSYFMIYINRANPVFYSCSKYCLSDELKEYCV